MLCAYLVVDSILALTYDPTSKWWISNYYLHIEPLGAALRFLCAVELVFFCVPRRYFFPLLFADMLFSLALPIILWIPKEGSAAAEFAWMRAYFQVYTGMFMLTAFLVLSASGRIRKGVMRYHALILLLLLLKQGIYSTLFLRGPWTNRGWYSADLIGLTIVSLCWFAWTANALYASRDS